MNTIKILILFILSFLIVQCSTYSFRYAGNHLSPVPGFDKSILFKDDRRISGVKVETKGEATTVSYIDGKSESFPSSSIRQVYLTRMPELKY